MKWIEVSKHKGYNCTTLLHLGYYRIITSDKLLIDTKYKYYIKYKEQ